MTKLPQHLILPDKVYQLTTSQARGTRTFDKNLDDRWVEGINPLSDGDKWKTVLGISLELTQDFLGFREAVPLEWVSFRFLCHFVRTNSTEILRDYNGPVLTTTNYQDYLGHRFPDKEADQILRVVLRSWVRTFPQKTVSLCDIYVSTDMTIDQLKRSINSLMSLEHIQETEEGLYKIKPSIFDEQVL